MKNRGYRRLLSLLATLALLVSLMPAAFAADSEKHITILGTSDMHGNIWGFAYEDNAESTNNGMARLYTYIQQVRVVKAKEMLASTNEQILSISEKCGFTSFSQFSRIFRSYTGMTPRRYREERGAGGRETII